MRPEAAAIQHDIGGDDRCAAACAPTAPVHTRIWSTRRCLVAPWNEGRRPSFAVAQAMSAAAGWPVVRRRSGGLTVPNGQGVLNLTIARLSRHPGDPATAYRELCGLIVRTLSRQAIEAEVGPVAGAFCDGRHNVVVGGRKLAGTAQRWAQANGGTGTCVVAHALILADLDRAAAVEAVNAYYAQLELPARFSSDAVVTLSELGIDAARFTADLQQAVSEIGPPLVEATPCPAHPAPERI